MLPKMLIIFCPFCNCTIRAIDVDDEAFCDDCEGRFPIESGDACFAKDRGKTFDIYQFFFSLNKSIQKY